MEVPQGGSRSSGSRPSVRGSRRRKCELGPSRAISIAALALAFSFATLAIIPIAPFREFAFAVCIGVVLDAFLVRTLMIPALLAAFGDRSSWPRRRRPAETVSAAG